MNELYVTVVVPNNAISLFCDASDTEDEDDATEVDESVDTETEQDAELIETEEEYPPTDPSKRPGSVTVTKPDGTTEIQENLAKTDPKLLNKILNTIKTATDSACVVDYTHPANAHCKVVIDDWNANHPNDKVDIDDVVRSVGLTNYFTSVWSTDTARLGEFLHVFKNVDAGLFTQGSDKFKLYVKFATPVGGAPFDVVSFHRNKQLDHKLAYQIDPNNVAPPPKRKRSKKKKKTP